jgi:antirestriction protein ArdC
MAMTNQQIIETEKMLRNITEEIHTFERWKELGFSVKKGERSTIKFPIWKYGKKKIEEDEDGKSVESKGYCFMKMSAFFTEKQVEPMKARA